MFALGAFVSPSAAQWAGYSLNLLVFAPSPSGSDLPANPNLLAHDQRCIALISMLLSGTQRHGHSNSAWLWGRLEGARPIYVISGGSQKRSTFPEAVPATC